MFTGIIKEIGKINKIINKGKDIEIEIESKALIKNIKIGDSISVNGCCLTAKSFTSNSFTSDISFNTLDSTTFKYARIGEIVNLEDSLTPTDKLGGHFVTGHVDSTNKILKISKIGSSYKLDIELSPETLPYITSRGSISIEGISLTVTEAGKNYFCVVIIPHTFTSTNMKFKKVGDYVNIEVDLISRYIAHILKNYNYHSINHLIQEENIQNENNKSIELRNKLLNERLKKYGFIK